MNLKFLCGIAAIALLVGATWASAEESTPRFAFYLVDFVETETTPTLKYRKDYPQYKNAYVTQEYFCDAAVVRGEPILTEADIVEYCWEKQRIVLKPASASRWNERFARSTPLAGIPLQVMVDGMPEYGAMVWNPISSLACLLPNVWSLSARGYLLTGGAAYRENETPRPDARYSEKVKKVMVELGKLTEVCEDEFR
jgi:hypothetical protein